MSSSPIPSKLVIAAGTYEGVLAGWELRSKKLQLTFATPVHQGSVRSLCLTHAPTSPKLPGPLLSCGYDETLRTHDWHKRLTSSGEVKTPTDFGTPVCSAYCGTTHCVVGFSGGKLMIYKRRDWSVQHILAGHQGGLESVAVHPSSKLALTGGSSDGKLKLWDLTKGRLAYVNSLPPPSSQFGRTRPQPVVSLVWSPDGDAYGYAHGSHITVRKVDTGQELLDVELPTSRVNQIALLKGEEGLFVAAACNDGSLPVLAVSEDANTERGAIMAIEPVDSPVAGEERFKCIQSVTGYYVVAANSAGVVSLMDLSGAVRMIVNPQDDEPQETDQNDNPAGDQQDSDTTSDTNDDKDDELELAVDIIDSVRLGTGARIITIAAWCYSGEDREEEEEEEDAEKPVSNVLPKEISSADATEASRGQKRKHHGGEVVEMDSADIKRARELVSKAKKIQRRKEKRKKRSVNPGE